MYNYSIVSIVKYSSSLTIIQDTWSKRACGKTGQPAFVRANFTPYAYVATDGPKGWAFALPLHEQNEQNKLIKYCSVIGYRLRNLLGMDM